MICALISSATQMIIDRLMQPIMYLDFVWKRSKSAKKLIEYQQFHLKICQKVHKNSDFNGYFLKILHACFYCARFCKTYVNLMEIKAFHLWKNCIPFQRKM